MSRFFSERHGGLTPYTPGEQPQDRKYIKLNTNESPYPPAPLAQRLAREAVGDLQLYSDPECRALKQVAAEYYGVRPEELLFVNGSDEALSFAFMGFCDEKRPAVFADVTYGFYPVYAELYHIPVQVIPLKPDFRIDPEDYRKAQGTLFIANPNAQTGLALPVSAIEALVREDPDRLVVVDEAYVDFYGESCVPLIRRFDNLLVIQTLSKSRNMAGARLGVAIGCEALIRDMNTLKYSTNPYNVNRVTQAAGIGAFLEKAYFRSCCSRIVASRERLKAALKELGFAYTDSRSNFVLARCPAVPGGELYLRLKEQGILLRHFSDPRLNDWVRITVGSETEVDSLIDALTALVREKQEAANA